MPQFLFSRWADCYDRNETIRKMREIPQQGQKGIPKKQEGKTTRANQINGADSAKAQGPSNGGRAEPEKLTRVLARARGTPQKPHDPQQRWRSKSHEGGLQNKGVRKKKNGVAIQIWGARKKVRRFSADLFGNEFAMRARDPTPRCNCSRTAWNREHRR